MSGGEKTIKSCGSFPSAVERVYCEELLASFPATTVSPASPYQFELCDGSSQPFVKKREMLEGMARLMAEHGACPKRAPKQEGLDVIHYTGIEDYIRRNPNAVIVVANPSDKFLSTFVEAVRTKYDASKIVFVDLAHATEGLNPLTDDAADKTLSGSGGNIAAFIFSGGEYSSVEKPATPPPSPPARSERDVVVPQPEFRFPDAPHSRKLLGTPREIHDALPIIIAEAYGIAPLHGAKAVDDLFADLDGAKATLDAIEEAENKIAGPRRDLSGLRDQLSAARKEVIETFGNTAETYVAGIQTQLDGAPSALAAKWVRAEHARVMTFIEAYRLHLERDDQKGQALAKLFQAKLSEKTFKFTQVKSDMDAALARYEELTAFANALSGGEKEEFQSQAREGMVHIRELWARYSNNFTISFRSFSVADDLMREISGRSEPVLIAISGPNDDPDLAREFKMRIRHLDANQTLTPLGADPKLTLPDGEPSMPLDPDHMVWVKASLWDDAAKTSSGLMPPYAALSANEVHPFILCTGEIGGRRCQAVESSALPDAMIDVSDLIGDERGAER